MNDIRQDAGCECSGRRTLVFGVTAMSLIPAIAWARDAVPITIDPQDIKSLTGLIQAMKKAAGDRIPAAADVKQFYRAFAVTFVEHAQEAMRQGVNIPQWISNRLPADRKAAFPVLVMITVYGVTFLVPLKFFFEMALVSMGLIWWYVKDEIRERKERLKVSVFRSARGEV